MNRRTLERDFQLQMFEIYRRSGEECGYHAIRYLQMLGEYGGLGTARVLLLPVEHMHEGFFKLAWEFKRPEITVEWLVLLEPWRQLFSEVELAKARQRLKDVGGQPPG
jgi:hypothetical protein